MAALVYVLAICAANYLVFLFGPWWSIINSFALIGLDFILRDVLHERIGFMKVTGLAVISGVLSCINKALAEGEITDFYDFLDLLNAETRMNGGNHTRANTEDLLIATRGAGLERKHAGIKQVVYSPLGAHSEKPWEVRHRLELLYGDVPRIELFSRSAAPGWDAWGNEVDGDVKLVPGRYENAE